MNDLEKIKKFWNVDTIEEAKYERVSTLKGKNTGVSSFDEAIVISVINNIILKHTKDITGYKILDFGCGVGRILKFFSNKKEAKFYGTDISENMIKFCKEYCLNDNISLNLSEVGKINFKDNFFDIIYSFHVLQHIPTLEYLNMTLSEIHRIQKNKGISILHFNKKISETNKNLGSFEGYRPSYENCLKLLNNLNFKIIDTEFIENGSFVIYCIK